MSEILTSLRVAVVTVAVCCGAYALAIQGFAEAVVPEKAAGSLIKDAEGRVIGSRQVAQNFTSDKYFWPRPSAADYKGDAAAGSNLSPANPALAERAQGIIEKLGVPAGEKVPVDLVTASGSGLDPHITLAAAELQAPRVARARGLGENELRARLREMASPPAGGLFGGEPLVNVLEANLALDGR